MSLNGATSRVRSVDEITLEIKGLIEGRFRGVGVEGEVVSCRPASSGHVYFTLKGRDASISAVMWRTTARRLARPLRDGDHVVCHGDVEVYGPHGKYQLVVDGVTLDGEGALLAALEVLKRKLAGEGLFAAERKRPLPFLPRRVGVVTSPTGAAIRDIVRSIHIRFPAPILVAAAQVQGDGAPPTLIQALRDVASVPDVDVVVIGRGGGSLQDLWAFNDEALCRAIAACPKPVVSAVGHEIDTLLTDYVADVRAPTPTAAGELVVPIYEDLLAHLAELRARAARGLALTARHAHTRLSMTEARLRDPRRLIRERWQRLDDLDARLRRAIDQRRRDAAQRLDGVGRRLAVVHPVARLRREAASLAAIEARLHRAWLTALDRARARLGMTHAGILGLSPTAVLDRGYAIVRRLPDRAVVRAAGEVAPGSAVDVMVAKGSFTADVTAVSES